MQKQILRLPGFCKLTLAVEEGRCTLRWLWPEQLEAVYVERLELNRMDADRVREGHGSGTNYGDHAEGLTQGKLEAIYAGGVQGE